MRTFEIIVVSLLVAGSVLGIVSGVHGGPALCVLLALALLTLLIHLLFEGAHWQMAPAHIAVLVFIILAILRNQAGTIWALGAWTVIVLALLSSLLSAILPMFRLPRPTGPYLIGTRTLYIVDQDRDEDVGPANGGKRELMVQLWYPASPSNRRYATYRRRTETSWMSSYQSVVPTHSRSEAPIAKGTDAFQVLLFNPAWNGRRTQNTYLVEDLASHGFVVAAIDHTYNSEPVAFPDGRVVHFQPEPGMDFNLSLATVEATAEKELIKQTADNICVLNQLEAMNRNPRDDFFGRLDINNTGALGHSFGGAVSAQLAFVDDRVRAVLDLDGSFWGPVSRQGLSKPLMLIQEPPRHPRFPEFATQADRVNQALDENDTAVVNKSGAYRIFMQGSTHESFTDRAMFSPLRALSRAGQIRPRRQFSIIRAYALAFFQATLQENSDPLRQLEKRPFPEAALEQRNPVPQ